MYPVVVTDMREEEPNFWSKKEAMLQQEPALVCQGHMLLATKGKCDIKLLYIINYQGLQNKCTVCECCSLNLFG